MKKQHHLWILAVALLCTLSPGCASFAAETALSQSPPARAASQVPPDARVDLNSASLNQLLAVPGMSRSWAARIIRFRPYRSKADLVERGVITSEVYARIRDYVIAHRAKQ